MKVFNVSYSRYAARAVVNGKSFRMTEAHLNEWVSHVRSNGHSVTVRRHS